VQVAKDAWGDLNKPLEHRYSRLLQVCDIAALLQVYPSLDWGRVLADTRRLGGQRMLLFGLCVAHELLGTTLPEAVRHRVQAHPAIGVLAAHVRAQWLQEADESAAPSLTPARVYFALRERWQDRVFPYLYAGALLIVPSDKDRRFLPLPGCLAFLYYGIRPLRVVREYGLCLFFHRLKRWLVWSN
jgi:putative nucleotidyltransferase-like protein